MRLLLVMIFLVASAVGLHFYGINLLSGFQKKEAAAKKLRAVKPKFIRDKGAKAASDKPIYTFFEILNDPTMTRYVGLNGKLLPAKIAATPLIPPVEKQMESDEHNHRAKETTHSHANNNNNHSHDKHHHNHEK